MNFNTIVTNALALLIFFSAVGIVAQFDTGVDGNAHYYGQKPK